MNLHTTQPLGTDSEAKTLTDLFGRTFTYLRLSLTDKCNFKCRYCLPNGYTGSEAPGTFLSSDEIRRLLNAFSDLGLSKVRFTGGEPTVRKDFFEVLSVAQDCSGITKIALTTNGYRLAEIAEEVFERGVRAINISVDSLDREKFARMTGKDLLPRVLTGIDRALEMGFDSVKINVVYMRDFSELEPFLEYVKNRPVSVRFIELMQTGDNLVFFKRRHSSTNILSRYLDEQGWQLRKRRSDDGPAKEYNHPDYLGRIGIIAPYSKDFCVTCNRLRISARGDLKLCLFGNNDFQLRHFLQRDEQCEELQMVIQNLLAHKRRSHFLHYGDTGTTKNLSVIGG